MSKRSPARASSRGVWPWSNRLVAFAAVLLALGTIAGDTRAAAPVGYMQRVVIDAALKSTVPPELALAVARVEGSRASAAGIGPMKVRPALARGEFGLRPDVLRHPKAGAGLGVALLERLYRHYDERWDLALSHYHAGPLPRCADGPVIHDHTLAYVADVMEWWRRYQKDERVAEAIRDIRRNGVGPGRFASVGTVLDQMRDDFRQAGQPARWQARRDGRFGTRSGGPVAPFGDAVPCCAGPRFF